MSPATERCLQGMLLLTCVLVLSFDLTTPVSCQAGCTPPSVTPGYMNLITLTQNTWTPGTSVTVKIDDQFLLWTSEAADRIEN
jgi:hypothetical protein